MEELKPTEIINNEEYPRNKFICVKQNVLVEDLNNNDLWKIIIILLLFFFSFFLPLKNIPGSTFLESILYELPKGYERMETRFSITISNITSKNVFSLLYFQFIQEQDVKHKPATFNIKVSSGHFNENELLYESENKWYHRFLLNTTYFPLHYANLYNITKIN